MSELGGGEEIVEGREDRNVEIVGKVPGKRPPVQTIYSHDLFRLGETYSTLMVGSSGG